MASQWQSVAVCGKVDHGRPRQSQVQPGTAGNSQDIKYDTERYIWGIKLGILWGMSGVLSGASSGACLGQHWEHIVNNKQLWITICRATCICDAVFIIEAFSDKEYGWLLVFQKFPQIPVYLKCQSI